MTAQVATAKELIGYLAEIIDESGDIPVITYSTTSNEIESARRPAVLPVIPTGEVGGFQAYSHASPEDASNLKAAVIY